MIQATRANIRAAAEIRPQRTAAAGRPMSPASASPFSTADNEAVKNVTLDIPGGQVTAIIGPSGCGKSTLLRAINRMNDLIPGCRTSGRLVFDGQDIYGPRVDVVTLRRRIGMVFQKPNPFPKSIFDNVAYGRRLHGGLDKGRLQGIVERSLRAPRCGTRSRTGWTTTPWASPAASSSGCASPGPWPSIPKSC